ncbi:MAG: 4a-hydroxytetrahydrobiopterin dehydratase [Cyanobacteria bacterium K_Offshore_0m_m2_072]|nr:4a-hydroxytetrahydrobiopterin dehydratase [Cyanobacteria bacterium K_Offshore_0m_m2_072]
MDQPWTPRPKPEQPDRLERRIEFADYQATRDFLERLNGLFEARQRFADLSFGRTYVNITVRPDGNEAVVGPDEQALADAIDALLTR